MLDGTDHRARPQSGPRLARPRTSVSTPTGRLLPGDDAGSIRCTRFSQGNGVGVGRGSGLYVLRGWPRTPRSDRQFVHPDWIGRPKRCIHAAKVRKIARRSISAWREAP